MTVLPFDSGDEDGLLHDLIESGVAIRSTQLVVCPRSVGRVHAVRATFQVGIQSTEEIWTIERGVVPPPEPVAR